MTSSKKQSTPKLLQNDRWADLKRAEQEIELLFIDEPLEHGALVSEAGWLIIETLGSKSSVKFPISDLRRVTNGIILHNHPSGTSFTLEDIRIACDFNPVCLSVFGRNSQGIRYRHIMKRPRKGWPKKRSLSEAYKKAAAKAENNLYKQKSMTPTVFRNEIAHEAMKELAKLIGAKYDRFPVVRG